MRVYFYLKLAIVVIIGLTFRPCHSYAYSVLTHEAIIDACWEKKIEPLLKIKFPNATAEQLLEANAYAYGGCVAPDMGYYPFGSKFFTELVHYVRTGDFVNTLISEAKDINEYAFALGFLCHYNADKYGHPIAINRTVPLLFPEAKEKYGDIVTYEQDPTAHVRMEFGFDVLQTARGNYAAKQYHSFIGFKISRPVLERAFVKTYGMDINDVFKDLSLSIETFRWIIKNFFPVITKAAWANKRNQIKKSNPSITRRNFEYRMKRVNYYHEFGKKHERPGFFPSVLSVVVKAVPKAGVLKTLKIKVPGEDAEKLFIQSFDTVVAHCSSAMNELAHNNNCHLPNIDFDTGTDTYAGEYDLADRNYNLLLLTVKNDSFKKVNARLKKNILVFYDQCNENIASKAGPEQWKNIKEALSALKALKTN